jgi:hypothetical protein
MASMPVLPVPFGPLIGKGLANHLEKRTLVNANVPSTGAVEPLAAFIGIVKFINACLMAAKQFSLADLVIAKQLFPAGRAA